jgi:hypothetical protein
MSRHAACLALLLLALFPASAAAFPDADADGLADGSDNCQFVANASQADADSDGLGDACDGDMDNDGYANASDAFPRDVTEHADADHDGVGDNLDTDDDDDTIADGGDNCPFAANVAQVDQDHDGLGDACDADRDGDGYANAADAFPDDALRHLDADHDGVDDPHDNCPATVNASQLDLDLDAIGDACDPDRDGDGTANGADAFPDDPLERADLDGDATGDNADLDDDNDGVADTGDNCPVTANPTQADTDGDHVGNPCDGDIDGDGYANALDALPLDPTEHLDFDHDGIGDVADLDDDGDGTPDVFDAFPANAAERFDSDADGVGDNGDNCRTTSNPTQGDVDADHLGDACDPDIDNDGHVNAVDAFPSNPGEALDSDGDGIGNNADTDDDNDGMPDVYDELPLDRTEVGDLDGDGVGDRVDNCRRVGNPAQSDRDGDGLGDACDPFPDGGFGQLLAGDPAPAPAATPPASGLPAADPFVPPSSAFKATNDDWDGDGVPNALDVAPRDPLLQQDSDRDGVGDKSDPCPTSAARTCRPAAGKPSVSAVKTSVSSAGELRVGFTLKRAALLTFVISRKVCSGRGCMSIVAVRTVPGAAGANRLVLRELKAGLPRGRYRLDVRADGSRTPLQQAAFTVKAGT